MDEIALEAAVSKPTIYQHFKTKDDLYVALLLPCATEMESRLSRIEEKLKEGKYKAGGDVIWDIGKSFLAVFLKNQEMFRVFIVANQQMHLEKSINETVLAEYMSGKTSHEIGMRIAELSMEQGLMKKVETTHLVDALWGTLLGVLQLAIVRSKDGQSFDDLEETLQFAASVIDKRMFIDCGS
jgi:AcrR family transcriptional regulator